MRHEERMEGSPPTIVERTTAGKPGDTFTQLNDVNSEGMPPDMSSGASNKVSSGGSALRARLTRIQNV
jgi:hypothetical protein